MSATTALIVCPQGNAVNQKLLGLTVGERLLLTLEKGGVTQVSFIGEGPRPVSDRARLKIMAPGERPPSDHTFWLIPADLVMDGSLLSAPTLPADLPLVKWPATKWAEALANPAMCLERLGENHAAGGKGYVVRATDRPHVKRAEKSLLHSLKKEADGIVSRHLNRRISTFISKRLAALPIRPNHITAVVFLVGVAAGPLAFLATPLGFALGGLCFWLSAVLDGCDGEISRLKYWGSPLGAWLDTVVDDIACLSYMVGMYLGLHKNAAHPYWLYLGIFATVFFLLTILPRYAVMARSGSGDFQKLAQKTRPKNRGLLSAFFLAMRDVVFRTDFLPFAGMVTAVVGYPQVFALPFGLGTLASAIDSVVTFAKFKPQ